MSGDNFGITQSGTYTPWGQSSGNNSNSQNNSKQQQKNTTNDTDKGGVSALVLNVLTLLVKTSIHIIKAVLKKIGMHEAAERFGTLSQKGDPVYTENWIRNLYKDSDNFMINFNLINEYREFKYPKDKFPGAWIPVPPNLERGVFWKGKMLNGEDSKVSFLSSVHWNPSLLASAYRATAAQAIAASLFMCGAVSVFLWVVLADMISLHFKSYESWGSLGVEGFFSITNAIKTSSFSLICIAIMAMPALFFLRLARAEHDVIAHNETFADIERQLKHYGGDEAARDSVTLSHQELGGIHRFSEVRAGQLNNFWRVFNSKQPLVKTFVDDGTARERGMDHGLEAGTQILMSLEEKCTSTLVTGEPGSGKTTKFALPDFGNYLAAMIKYGMPIQGLGGDGKVSLHHKMKKMLIDINFDQSKFIEVGIDQGSFGCPMFHDMTPDALIGIIKDSQPLLKDDFFTIQARIQIRASIVIGKTVHLTPMGAQYEIDNNGETTDSPVFVQRLCNDPEFLYKTISDLTDYLKTNDRARKALYTKDLKIAFTRCLTSWKRYMASEEMVNGIIASVDTYLNPLTESGDICDRFGSGRFGADYKDPTLMLNGYFFFMTIDAGKNPGAARMIGGVLRARLFNAMRIRAVEFEKLGIPGWKSPVYVNIDEHHLLATGGVDGLSDTSIFNISRSMGLCFTGMTQSTDSYITSLGEVQTENMTQNMLTRVMLPTTSKRDQDYIATTFGTRYVLTVDHGVFPTEGARELKNGGVMTVPRTEIRKVTSISPMGMPESMKKVSRDLVEDNEKSLPTIAIPFSSDAFIPGCGHPFLELIGAHKTMDKHRDARIRFSAMGFLFGSYDSRPLLSLLDKEGENDPEAEKFELAAEQTSRMDGISKEPLFSQDDFLQSGTAYAIIRTPHYGIDYALRSKLDGIYI